MEKFVVELVCFVEILLLHLLTHFAMLAVGRCRRVVSVGGVGHGERRTVLGKEQLVDDDVVRVDFVRRQFLYETFRFIEGQEFGYADADERGLFLRKRPDVNERL